MKPQNSNKPGRKSSYAPVRTVDLFNQPNPLAYANLGYNMSVSQPLQDPCAYASSVSGPSQNQKQANRIQVCLGSTFERTNQLKDSNNTRVQIKANDPLLSLAKIHDIETFKKSMKVGGVSCQNYPDHLKFRSQAVDSVAAAGLPISQDESILDANETTLGSESMATSTPMRRNIFGSQLEGSAKRQRTVKLTASNTSMDGDVSLDTVRSVLRLVDESLIYTPEKTAVSTPKVLRSAPVPSPRESGPTFAYNKQNAFESFGGLAPKSSAPTLFGVTRI